jgi:hypothetical protein
MSARLLVSDKLSHLERSLYFKHNHGYYITKPLSQDIVAELPNRRSDVYAAFTHGLLCLNVTFVMDPCAVSNFY